MAHATENEKPTAAELMLPDRHLVSRLPLLAGGFGIVFLVVTVVLAAGLTRQFYFAWLVACLFVLTVSLGSMIFVLIQFATRAGWSVAVRRIAEHTMGAMPVAILLFLPLLAGVHELFEWSHSEAADHLLEHKQPYLNTTFLYIRTGVIALCWCGIALWFRRKSMSQDAGRGDTATTRRLQAVSAPAIAVFAVTLTFFMFDWIMSLEAHWFSTVFGVYLFGGSLMAGLAWLVLWMNSASRGQSRLGEVLSPEHYHDVGKLLFGFVVFWAYIGFSQFMLIWYGNIPEETIWYAHRLEHGWKAVSVLLMVGHFAIPFLLLLSRDIKRRPRLLGAVSCWVLAMHYVDMYWLVMPSFNAHFSPSLVDLTALLATVGIFTAAVAYLMKGSSLVPTGDPRLNESLSFENT